MKLPDWTAFAAAGWTASFTDASNGLDITAQITGAAGWQTVINDGDTKEILATVTAPQNSDAGALTFRAESVATGGTPAIDVVKALWSVPAPTLDLAIRAPNGAWLGQSIVNEDGTDQTLETVADSSHVASGQLKLSVAGAPNGQTVTWSVPAWATFHADGWSAKFFDAPTEGNEITAQITGTGWTTTHTNGTEPVIRWEVTAPAGVSDVTRVLSVRAALAGGVADVVKASVRVLPDIQPDVSISALDENNLPDEWVGEGQLSPTPQSVAKVWGAGETHAFALRIKNTGPQAAPFVLSWPALPSGWEVKIYNALEGGALLEGEIASPAIAPNESLIWRAEVTAIAPAQQAMLPIRVGAGSSFDEVTIDGAMQSLAGLQWSVDGENWTDVTAETQITVHRNDMLGLRALKSVPNLPWPYPDQLRPKWSSQSYTHFGEIIWVHFPKVGPAQTITAECGNTASVSVVVAND